MYRTYILLSILALAASAGVQTTLFEINQIDQLYLWTYADNSKKVNETGEAFRLASSGATLKGFDLPDVSWQMAEPANPATLEISDLHLLVTVFGSFQQDYQAPGNGPEFSNPLETVQYDISMPWKWFWHYHLVGTPDNPYFKFPTSIPLAGQTVGIQFTFLGLIGGVYKPLDFQVFCSFSHPFIGDNALRWSGDQREFFGVNRYDSDTSLPQNVGYGNTYDNLDVILYGEAGAQPLLMMSPQTLGPGF